MTRSALRLAVIVLALAAAACGGPTPWGGIARETGHLVEAGR